LYAIFLQVWQEISELFNKSLCNIEPELQHILPDHPRLASFLGLPHSIRVACACAVLPE